MISILKKSKGIVLVTTLFITTFLVMLAAGTLSSSMMQLKISSDFYQREAAHHMALAGINYAMLRMEDDSNWKGCHRNSAGKGEYFKFEVDETMLVSEHPVDVDNAMGAVEGRLRINENTFGYFDIYFVHPEDAVDEMEFYVHHEANPKAIASSPAGAIPRWIPISFNNYGLLEGAESKGSDSLKYKDVPANTVLLVSRGRVGNETKMVETCVRMIPKGDYDGVISGRGNLNIGISGGWWDMIKLRKGSFNKPPIIKSCSDINFTYGDGKGPKKDYIEVSGGGGGQASGKVNFKPDPLFNKTAFKGGVADQTHSLPPLKLEEIKPDTSSMPKIAAGTYIVNPGTSGGNPEVLYYPSIQYDLIGPEGLIEAQADNDILARIADGTLEWDNDNMTLTQRESMAVQTSTGPIYDETETFVENASLGDVYIKTNSGKRLVYKLESPHGTSDSVYFINDNDEGAISVEGELSGIGTVMCKGDINMEAQSQLSADTESGLAIYSEGNVIIHQIGKMPGTSAGDLWGTDRDTLEQLQILTESLWNAFSDYTHNPKDSFSEEFSLAFSNPVLYGESGIGSLTYNKTWKYYSFVDGAGAEVARAYDKQGHVSARIEVYQAAFAEGQWDLLKDLKLTTGGWGYTEFFKVDRDSGAFFTELIESGRPVVVEGLQDSVFRGLVFACKDFTINTHDTGFRLEGGLVAYGGIPGGDEIKGSGNVNIYAKNAEFVYETKYLSILNSLGDNNFESLYWGSLPRKD